MNAKEQFINQVIRDNPNTETATLLTTNKDCGYYELCQKFLDVALNAPKVRTETGALAGVFQHVDIEIAKKEAALFLHNNTIEDIDNFFDIFEHAYPLSASPEDTRQKTAFIRESDGRYVGCIGTFYSFTSISDDIYAEIISEIKSQIKR